MRDTLTRSRPEQLILNSVTGRRVGVRAVRYFATRFWNAQNGHILEPIYTEKFHQPINLTWV